MPPFELHGADGDETRLLVHPALGFAAAIPGRPRLVAPPSELPRYDVVLQLEDTPVELGFRMDEIPTAITADRLLPPLLHAYASNRAGEGAPLRSSALPGPLLARGASAGGRVNYVLRGADDAPMEFLAILVKQGEGAVHALHFTARYRRADLTPFAWANLRAALLGHQSWTPGALPSTEVWPAKTIFAPRSARFELTDDAFRAAQAKAEGVGPVAPDEVERIADLFIGAANTDFPPAALLHPVLAQTIASRVRSCLPQKAAEILLLDLGGAESMHDFRAWLWQCFWAVGNRAELRARRS